MKNVPILHFIDRQIQGPCYHLTSVDSARNRMLGYHGHDYPEIFWIQRGACRHQINDGEQHLSEGDVVLMRVEDRHELCAIDSVGFGFGNLSIAPEIFHGLLTRFPSPLGDVYEEGSPLPRVMSLSVTQRAALAREARHLAAEPHMPFYLERFLFNLWARCLWVAQVPPVSSPHSSHSLPDWLQEACVRVQEPEVFCGGVPAFVRCCGRSHEHVSRMCREKLGKTPTALVHEARLARASNELRTTSLSVSEIALECGFEDPGTFYRLFKRHFGTTPRTYRSAV